MCVFLLFVNLLGNAQSSQAIEKIDRNRRLMYECISRNQLGSIADFYTTDAIVNGDDVNINGIDAIRDYWKGIKGKGFDWNWEIINYSGNDDFIYQSGISHLTLNYGQKNITYSSNFTVVWEKKIDGEYKILYDFYRFKDRSEIPFYEIVRDSSWIITKHDTLFAYIFKPKIAQEIKIPAIFCIQGGGNVGVRNYFYEAELFAQAGIYSVVCDKAGSGKSKGNSSWITQSFKEKVEEYSLIIDWLCDQKLIDSNRIGLHGPSEGGRLALSVALSNPTKIKFVNAVSAPLETLKENQLFAIEKLVLKRGYHYSVIAQTLQIFNEYFEAINAKKIPKQLVEKIILLHKKYPDLYLPPATTNLPRMPHSDDVFYSFGSNINSLQCPIFFQYGINDEIVNVTNSIKLIPQKDNIQYKIYNNADHSLNDPKGNTNGSYHIDKLTWILSVI